MFDASGIGTYIRELVPRVMAARPDLSYVLLGPSRPPDHWPSTPSVETRWVECRAPIYSLREQWEVPRLVPSSNDLLWVPHFNVPLAYRGRLMVTVHDVFHLAQPRFAGHGLGRLVAATLLGAVRRRADAILAPSEFTASEFRKYVGEPRSITVTPLAAGPGWSLRPEGPSPHPRPYFLFVGNVKPHKNLAGLLEAFSSIVERYPHDLVVIGKKEGFRSGDKGSVERARALGDRVRFLGALGFDELKHWMAHAQAAVMPSYYEGFGLPPLEAMSLGTPVVVSDRASLPEVCGDAALYVDPDRPSSIVSALEHLAGDAGLREDMIRKGLARARTFDWDLTLHKTLPALERCLRG
jgi:glycosyltransferase involved in cell wall biosynthesis